MSSADAYVATKCLLGAMKLIVDPQLLTLNSFEYVVTGILSGAAHLDPLLSANFHIQFPRNRDLGTTKIKISEKGG